MIAAVVLPLLILAALAFLAFLALLALLAALWSLALLGWVLLRLAMGAVVTVAFLIDPPERAED